MCASMLWPSDTLSLLVINYRCEISRSHCGDFDIGKLKVVCLLSYTSDGNTSAGVRASQVVRKESSLTSCTGNTVHMLKSLSRIRLFVTPCTGAGSSVHGDPPGKNTGVGCHALLQGIGPRSPALQADSLPSKPPGKPKNTVGVSLSLLQENLPAQESNWGLLH